MTEHATIATVTVPLGKRSYPIYIGEGILRRAGTIIRKHFSGTTAVVITDSNVAKRYLRPLTSSLSAAGIHVRQITIPAGERQKSLGRAEQIYTRMIRWNIERSSVVIALGGGVVGDLAGFVAATYQRGIGFIQVPTSLLAQVDSSVGGKVGINHPLAKNMIGSFYQPMCVLADTAALRTLPVRERIGGAGEVVKYGIILDRALFDFTEHHLRQLLGRDAAVARKIVKRCCELKSYVVSRDEKEKGLRAILNFGHTVGHALERAGGYRLLKHGEAILYGMVAEAWISQELGFLSGKNREKIESAIASIPLPPLSRIDATAASLVRTMRVDKKAHRGRIRMVLPRSIGSTTLPEAVNEEIIVRALRYLSSWARTYASHR